MFHTEPCITTNGHVLVLEQRNLAGRHVEPLLLRLRKIRPLVDGEFRVINKGVVDVVVLGGQCLFLARDYSQTPKLRGESRHTLRFRGGLNPSLIFSSSSPSLSLVSRLTGIGVGGRWPVSFDRNEMSTS